MGYFDPVQTNHDACHVGEFNWMVPSKQMVVSLKQFGLKQSMSTTIPTCHHTALVKGDKTIHNFSDLVVALSQYQQQIVLQFTQENTQVFLKLTRHNFKFNHNPHQRSWQGLIYIYDQDQHAYLTSPEAQAMGQQLLQAIAQKSSTYRHHNNKYK